MNEVVAQKVPSPCIGVCSTGIGDSVCRGCKRFAHEVIDWNSYSDQQRGLIYGRINSFLGQVLKHRIRVLDERRLDEFLLSRKIGFNAIDDKYAKVFSLLKAGAQQLSSLEIAGCEVMPEYKHLPLSQLRNEIDQDFYTLSSAHYQRYFPH